MQKNTFTFQFLYEMKIRTQSPGTQQKFDIASSKTPDTIFIAAIDVLISNLKTQNAFGLD